ncbi:TPA: lysine biosynthesis protein LysX [Candidatus Micrarchaeota archaeon]|nr:lysine biosynthesis protein LysX [Candidatus Micrarchaeota archaeon]HIH30842.1 lysine biosynthesis protein LysX [Candidatus Micrarchaeota archaeon]
MKLGLCYTVISPENKMLLEAAEKRGVEFVRIVDGESVLQLSGKPKEELDVLLQRSVSYSRGLCLAYYYEKSGCQVINSYQAAKVCGDKMLSSLELASAGVPTPKTNVCFSPEAAMDAAEDIGFPIVMKPVMGSWARMVNRLNDHEALSMAVGCKEEMGNPWQKIYYLQEHIDKPGRDIRAFVVGEEVVAAIYRNCTKESGWVSNASRGGHPTECAVTSELSELCLRASKIAGEGIYGVDLMESGNGLVVHEINHTAEFKSCASATGIDIAGSIIDYAVSRAKS